MLNQSPSSLPSKPLTPKAQLRAVLLRHIEEFNDPILKALQGSGLDLIQVVRIWTELSLQVQAAHDEALFRGTIEDALQAASDKRQEIATRLRDAQREATR